MKKSLATQAIQNVGSSWAGLGVNIVVGFLLSPFILHRLGDDAFGLWVLVFSVTDYYGLFDMGIRSSIVRYVSRFHATGERDELAGIVNTTLFTYSIVAGLLMVVSFGASQLVTSIFRIPSAFTGQAPLLFVIVGISVALGFPLGVFGGILEGLQKFSWLNATTIVATLLRALLVVLALHRGYGLVTLALITAGTPVLFGMLRALMVFRLLSLPYGMRFVRRAAFHKVLGYGLFTLLVIVADRLRFRADAVIIGTLLSSAAITYFSIASKIVDYASEVVANMAQIFTPMSSHFDAKGEEEKLQTVLLLGNRASAFVIFPLTAGLIVLGESLIEVWMGVRYTVSYPVMLVLLVPTALLCAQASSTRVLFGIGRHRTMAWFVLAESLVNIALSVLLVRRYGIMGDAVGTAIPLLITTVFFLPWHVCHLLGLPIGRFVRECYSRPLQLALALALVLIVLQHWYVPHTYPGLGLQVLLGGGFYLAILLWRVARYGDLGPGLQQSLSRFVPGKTDQAGA
jgi:O-antigen/teichoic acid export membrane protein